VLIEVNFIFDLQQMKKNFFQQAGNNENIKCFSDFRQKASYHPVLNVKLS
jgi:hypothetical protein